MFALVLQGRTRHSTNLSVSGVLQTPIQGLLVPESLTAFAMLVGRARTRSALPAWLVNTKSALGLKRALNALSERCLDMLIRP